VSKADRRTAAASGAIERGLARRPRQIKVPRLSHRRQPHRAVAPSADEKVSGSIHSRLVDAGCGVADVQKTVFLDDRQHSKGRYSGTRLAEDAGSPKALGESVIVE